MPYISSSVLKVWRTPALRLISSLGITIAIDKSTQNVDHNRHNQHDNRQRVVAARVAQFIHVRRGAFHPGVRRMKATRITSVPICEVRHKGSLVKEICIGCPCTTYMIASTTSRVPAAQRRHQQGRSSQASRPLGTSEVCHRNQPERHEHPDQRPRR